MWMSSTWLKCWSACTQLMCNDNDAANKLLFLMCVYYRRIAQTIMYTQTHTHLLPHTHTHTRTTEHGHKYEEKKKTQCNTPTTWRSKGENFRNGWDWWFFFKSSARYVVINWCVNEYASTLWHSMRLHKTTLIFMPFFLQSRIHYTHSTYTVCCMDGFR